jgi:hypothetical protein
MLVGAVVVLDASEPRLRIRYIGLLVMVLL